MSESDPQSTSREVVKNYTRARKFPQLLGMTPDGKKLPGGPYSYTQFVGAGLVALVLWKTPGIWATGSLIRNVFVFLALVGVTAWGLGKLPIGGRNPLSMVAGVSKALGSPAQAPKVSGPSPRRPRVHALAGMVTLVPVPSLAAHPSSNTSPKLARSAWSPNPRPYLFKTTPPSAAEFHHRRFLGLHWPPNPLHPPASSVLSPWPPHRTTLERRPDASTNHRCRRKPSVDALRHCLGRLHPDRNRIRLQAR
ncbi:hypothetical protein GCM10020255_006340 [Rhodococcus baikonurensis]